jgi:CRISPR-associated endonuclease/helicase Cas3
LAARLHDEGKRAARWQRAFKAPIEGRPYAKTRGPIDFDILDGYRHELGSLPYVEARPEIKKLSADDQELVLHLIAAHHGFARPVIGTSGCDDAPPCIVDERARAVALRFARLSRRWGPWGLAWWEALLRAADQIASRRNQQASATQKERA